MAIIKTEIEFDYPAPKTEDVLEKISGITGLPVSITEAHEDEKIHDRYIYFAFDAFPGHTVIMYSYRPGAVRNIISEEIEVEGSDEKEGKQSLHLKVYLGQELTLYIAAIKALEALGGVNRKPLPVPGNEFNFPISVEELEKKHRKQEKQIKKHWLITILLLPILIPYYVILAIYGLIKMPFKIIRAYKEVKEK